MSIRISLVKAVLKKQFAGWNDKTIEQQRAQQAKALRLSRKLPLGIEYEDADVKGIRGAWFSPDARSNGAVLYLHGGAYCLGTINTHREMVGRLAEAVNRAVLVIEYRLAPEHPFPAALEDAQTAWRWLLNRGYHPGELFLAGDSAGGGLALSLLVSLRDAGEPMPAGAALLSPWTDLAMEGQSAFSNADSDPILNREDLAEKASLYAGSESLRTPLVSPLYADLGGLAPLLFQAGSDELLLDDSVRAAESARSAGTEADLRIFQEMFHVFHMMPFLPQADEAMQDIKTFMDNHEIS